MRFNSKINPKKKAAISKLIAGLNLSLDVSIIINTTAMRR